MYRIIAYFILVLILVPKTFCQEIIELKLPETNKITIKFMFTNGSVSDPTGKEGLTNLTANLVTSGGTENLSYNQIQEIIYPMAVRYNASVDKEVTVFTFNVHKDFLEDFYPIITGLILRPSFAESDYKRVKLNQQNYVDQIIRSSSDEEYSKKALEDFLFRGTGYQHMIEGKSESVKSITLGDVKTHYENMFTRNNLLIGIAGNYPDEFAKRLKEDMQKLPDKNQPLPIIKKPENSDGITVEIISKEDAFGSAIFMGFPIDITRANDDFAALMVANSYLGEHRKSYGVLYNKLRTTRSMNYGDYSYIEWFDGGGYNSQPPSGFPRSSNYFSVWIRPVQIAKQLKLQYPELSGIKTGHAHFAIRLAIREIEKLINEGISQKDFEATREFLRSYIKLYVQEPDERLGYLMDSKFYGRKDFINELGALLENLTLDDVNNAIKKYWQVNNMYITIVTDESEAEELAKSIEGNLTSPMSYSNLVKEGLPIEVLNEDNIVADYKLNVKSVSIINSEDTFSK
ncbi:MAG: insulinase family protein [Bacteroidetes bacterium]|nr:insulinase family protein [Bacteroidota bacterium]